MHRFALAAMALTAALALCACDDGDSAAADTFSSGVETGKTVSSLTDAEAQQICDAAASQFGNLVSKRKGCELSAAFFAPDAQSCQMFADQCVQAPEEPAPENEGGEDDCTIADAEKRMGCEETVESLEGCMGSIRGLAVNALGRISCADAGNVEGLEAKFADLPMGIADVPGCEAIAESCPALFDDDDTAMGMSSLPPIGDGAPQ
jgi:hypothetical protein